MAGIPRFEQEGLCSRVTPLRGKKECCYRTPPAGSPRHIALEALADWNSPRRSEPQAPRLLPRRIHFPIQPADLTSPRQVILPPTSTGSRRGTETVQIAHMWPRATAPKTPTTTYSGYLSKVHTPINLICPTYALHYDLLHPNLPNFWGPPIRDKGEENESEV